MILYILLGIAILVSLYVGRAMAKADGIGEGIAAGIFTLIFSAFFAWAIALAVGSIFGDYKLTETTRYELRDAKSYNPDDGVDGLYRYAPNEEPKAPYLLVKTYEKYDPWLYPSSTVGTETTTVVWEK